MYTILFNNKRQTTIEPASEQGVFSLNGKEVAADIKPLGDDLFHMIVNGKSYTAELVALDPAEKKFDVRINNVPFSFELRDEMDSLLERMGMNRAASAVVKDIKAPMPGLVVDVLVEPGQEVSEGDSMLILEAMKMENVIKSPGDGTVGSVQVNKGQTVEKNDILIKFD